MSKRTCTGPDCTRPVLAKGLCGAHYQQRAGGKPLRPLKPYTRRGTPEDQRFFLRVAEDGDCWRWVGATNRYGYGNFVSDDGRTWRAHRWAYTHLVGDIPDGLHLDHLCRNRWCVNPWHLDPVTPRVNVYERVPVEARNKPVPWATCGRGHPMTPENVYVNPTRGNRYCRICQSEARRQWEARRRST